MKEGKYILMFDNNSEYSKKDSIPFHRKRMRERRTQNLRIPENEKVKGEIKNHGIDVEKYKKKNTNDVYRTTKKH
jgi:hypothetical protein